MSIKPDKIKFKCMKCGSERYKVEERALTGTGASRFMSARVMIASSALILGAMAFTGVMNFLTLYLTDVFHTKFAFAALMLGVMQISAVLSAPVGGLASDKVGRKIVIIVGLLILGSLIFLFSILKLGLFMYIILFLMGFFIFIIVPAVHAYIADVTPSQHRSLLYSIFLTTSLGFEGITPVIVGTLIDLSSFKTSFIILAVLAFSGALAGFFIKKPNQRLQQLLGI